jgi:hypothetical protein
MDLNNIINEEVSRMKSLFGYQRGRVISEQKLNEDWFGDDDKRIANIGAIYQSVKNGIITQPGFYKGKNWVDFITDQNVSSVDLAAAKELNKKNQATQQTQNTRMQNIVNTINQIDPETATIKSSSKYVNGLSFDQYMEKYNVSQDDIRQAKAYVASLAKTQPEQAQKATEVLSQVSKTPPPAGKTPPPAGKTPPAGVVKPKSVKPDPKVMELQKQLVAAGYKLGTSGPNRDGIDGIMGPKTRAAQQQMTQQKGQQASQSMLQQGKNMTNQFNKTIQQNSKMTPEQIANAKALQAGQPLPQTKATVAPAAPVPTGPKPTGLGWAGQEQDGWVYDVNTKDWIPQS